MIIGESAKPEDLDVNPAKAKQLSNVRTVMKEDAVKLSPPKVLTLELALSLVKVCQRTPDICSSCTRGDMAQLAHSAL